MAGSQDTERVRQDLVSIQEGVQKIADQLLKMPGLSQLISQNEVLMKYFRKTVPQAGLEDPSSTSIHVLQANQRLKGIIEVINLLSRQLTSRVQECNQMT